MRPAIYVGIREDRTRAVFRSPHRHDLVAGLCPEPFVACIGPFRTVRAANFMASPSAYCNPHVQCVADAERISKEAA